MNKKQILINAAFIIVLLLVINALWQNDAPTQQQVSAPSPQDSVASPIPSPQAEPDLTADFNSSQLTAGEETKMRQVVERFARTLPRVIGNDPRVRTVYDYYQREAIFGRPRASSIIAGAAPNGRQSGTLGVVIVSPEEAARLGDENAHMSTFRYRSDMSATGTVIMDQRMLTEPWEEQALLHELWHAYVDKVLHQADAGRERIGTHEFAIQEEADAHTISFNVVNRWTGGRYEELIGYIARWRLDHSPNNLTGQIRQSEARALDALFPPCEQDELRLRYPQYEIDLAVAIARIRGQDQNTARMEVLRRLYREIYGH